MVCAEAEVATATVANGAWVMAVEGQAVAGMEMVDWVKVEVVDPAMEMVVKDRVV